MSRVYRDSGYHPAHSRHKGAPRYKRPVKKWDAEKLYAVIKTVVVGKQEQRERDGEAYVFVHGLVFREELEDQFKASTSDVMKVLMRLNREGLLGQKTRFFAHDSSRDPMFGFKGWSGWAANVYYVKNRTGHS